MRLIDADKLEDALNTFKDYKNGNEHFLFGIETARELVSEAVSVDAVPAVRCAECRHFVCNLRPDGFLPDGVGETECMLFHCGMDYTDYCSYGKRKGGAE